MFQVLNPFWCSFVFARIKKFNCARRGKQLLACLKAFQNIIRANAFKDEIYKTFSWSHVGQPRENKNILCMKKLPQDHAL